MVVYLQLEGDDSKSNTRVLFTSVSGEELYRVENIRSLSKSSPDVSIVNSIIGDEKLDFSDDDF